jgi:hypothetical protein
MSFTAWRPLAGGTRFKAAMIAALNRHVTVIE